MACHFRLAHPIAIAAFCLIALPWYALCAFRNPDFLRVFIFQHNFERYLTPLFQHRQPFWYFVPILLLGQLPVDGVPLACSPRRAATLAAEILEQLARILYAFAGLYFPFLFFSFSQSKLPGYILPAIPPLAFVDCGESTPVLTSHRSIRSLCPDRGRRHMD